MKIDIKNSRCLYIEIGDFVYYIDDTTNEQIFKKYRKSFFHIKTKNHD